MAETDEDNFTLIAPRKISRKPVIIGDDEPLIDTTASLELRSKKTERLQKRRQKKIERKTVRSEVHSFLELPPELLEEVLSYLAPSDILQLRRLNRATFDFIQHNQHSIAIDVIRRRYCVLTKSFPLPVPISKVNASDQRSLLSTARQERITGSKNAYHHIKPFDPTNICTCNTCILSWNNLCIILDLAYFQRYLRDREPIPMIPRGSRPEWNEELINKHARVVESAMENPLVYATILEKHLATIVGTLTRQIRVGKRTFSPRKLYQLSREDVASETDAFLERQGDPSYMFPYHRDNYYSMEAYVPNRKWSKELEQWQYMSARKLHENDVAWVVRVYRPDP